ncbi:MAG: 3,5-nucleoside bisphosphate phosphatase [Burkholderiaceae bacterium]|nr:3,5-nucleoside bisphosphate phosphatase [Burkholderiaceae bacterium]
MRVDYHCHSTASDGALTPEQLVTRAVRNGTTDLALTDHDQLSGLMIARACAQQAGIRFVDGVEVSCSWRGMSVHIVGLNIDIENAPLIAGLQTNAGGRAKRAVVMAQALEEVGVKNALERALAEAGGRMDLLARTHFARVMVADKKAESVRHVFQNYLVEGKPGFVPHEWASIEQALTWIHDAGGVAVLAHPGRYPHDEASERELVAEFIGLGGQAIEVITGAHSKKQIRYYVQMCVDLNLHASSGSDFHGVGESKMDVGRVPNLPEKLQPVYQLWA